jgi:hypothetical protein
VDVGEVLSCFNGDSDKVVDGTSANLENKKYG